MMVFFSWMVFYTNIRSINLCITMVFLPVLTLLVCVHCLN